MLMKRRGYGLTLKGRTFDLAKALSVFLALASLGLSRFLIGEVSAWLVVLITTEQSDDGSLEHVISSFISIGSDPT
jgi:hypothetical protein